MQVSPAFCAAAQNAGRESFGDSNHGDFVSWTTGRKRPRRSFAPSSPLFHTKGHDLRFYRGLSSLAATSSEDRASSNQSHYSTTCSGAMTRDISADKGSQREPRCPSNTLLHNPLRDIPVLARTGKPIATPVDVHRAFTASRRPLIRAAYSSVPQHVSPGHSCHRPNRCSQNGCHTASLAIPASRFEYRRRQVASKHNI